MVLNYDPTSLSIRKMLAIINVLITGRVTVTILSSTIVVYAGFTNN
jgi:hypothetical protein